MGVWRVFMWFLIAVLVVILGWRRYQKGHFMALLSGILLLVILVYAGFCLLVFSMQSKMLYQPSSQYIAEPDEMGLLYQPVTLRTPDGETITGWYVPAEDAKWTVLFCHGNAGNISHRLGTLQVLHEMNANCLIIDYRGYGKSSGKPTEQGTLLDIKAGWDWLVNEQKIDSSQIILFGRSLGGSIAAITAVDLQPAAVILESTFTSFVEIGRHYYPWMPVRWFARFQYDTLAAVQQLSCPVFITHSPDDEIVPYRFGQALFEAASPPKLFRPLEGTHNEGFYDNSQLYRDIWREWFEALRQAKTD